MSEIFDVYTLLLVVLAIAIILRLRSVLGRKTGNEQRDYDVRRQNGDAPAASDKVVRLPRAGEPARAGAAAQLAVNAEERIRSFMPEAGSTTDGLIEIAKNDPAFEPGEFLKGASSAYEMIVTAYAAGDRRQLRNLLNREVYDGFEAAIREREQRGETVETRFVSIDVADFTGAELRGKTEQVTVRFVSQLVSVTRDRSGTVIDGNPDKVTDVTDVWTFARDTSSRDPNWKLVATEAGQ